MKKKITPEEKSLMKTAFEAGQRAEISERENEFHRVSELRSFNRWLHKNFLVKKP